MRIFGNGKDYYDGVRAYGAERNVIFHRSVYEYADSHENPFKTLQYRFLGFGSLTSTLLGKRRLVGNAPYFYPIYVWIAGTLYCGVVVLYANSNKRKFLWTFEKFQEVLDKEQIYQEDAGWWRKSADVFRNYQHITEQYFTPKKADDWQLNYLIENQISTGITEYDRGYDPKDHHCPYMKWRFNTDGLKSTGIQKIVDPQQAYQELSMWIGGVLQQPKPIVEITDDKVILAKHGMDHWSFRKQSGQRG